MLHVFHQASKSVKTLRSLHLGSYNSNADCLPDANSFIFFTMQPSSEFMFFFCMLLGNKIRREHSTICAKKYLSIPEASQLRLSRLYRWKSKIKQYVLLSPVAHMSASYLFPFAFMYLCTLASFCSNYSSHDAVVYSYFSKILVSVCSTLLTLNIYN